MFLYADRDYPRRYQHKRRRGSGPSWRSDSLLASSNPPPKDRVEQDLNLRALPQQFTYRQSGLRSFKTAPLDHSGIHARALRRQRQRRSTAKEFRSPDLLRVKQMLSQLSYSCKIQSGRLVPNARYNLFPPDSQLGRQGMGSP